MRYKGKDKKRDRRRNSKMILLGLCGLSCFLAIICLVWLFRLRADLRELDRQLWWNGEIMAADLGAGEDGLTDVSGKRAGEAAPDRTKAQDPAEDTEGNYPDRWGLDNVDSPRQRTEKEVLGRLRELGEDSELIADILRNRSDYPKKLLEALANNPEMADFVSGWHGTEETAEGGLTESEKEQDFPLFLQWDPRWGYVEYGDDSCIGLAGCGPTCLSMALYYLTGDESLTPDRVGDYSMENGCYISGIGTAWVLMEVMPLEYGIGVRQPVVSEEEMERALNGGALSFFPWAPVILRRQATLSWCMAMTRTALW